MSTTTLARPLAAAAPDGPARLSVMDSLAVAPYVMHRYVRNKVDDLIVRYDAWFLVLLAVLMVLAFAMLAAMAIWCMSRGKGRFSGNWRWGKTGVSVWIECR